MVQAMVRFFALLMMSCAVAFIFCFFVRPFPPGASQVESGKIAVNWMIAFACLILGGYYGLRYQTKK